MLANDPDVQARFYKKAAFQSEKTHRLPEVDSLGVGARRESVAGARV